MTARRQAVNAAMLALCWLLAAAVLLPLLLLLAKVVAAGLPALSWSFFTQAPAPPGEPGGGLGNAMLGSLEMLLIAAAVGLPLGLLSAVYLSEHRAGWLPPLIRFATDMLTGAPTIVLGLFVYAVVVVPMHRFSGLAGGLALAAIFLPFMVRAAEQALLAVPRAQREAAAALGASRAVALRRLVLRAARPGLVAAALLASARIVGETAPLLLTALNSSLWPGAPDRPMASLPVQIYDYAVSPYAAWHAQAWAGALVLLAAVLLLGLLARAAGGHA